MNGNKLKNSGAIVSLGMFDLAHDYSISVYSENKIYLIDYSVLSNRKHAPIKSRVNLRDIAKNLVVYCRKNLNIHEFDTLIYKEPIGLEYGFSDKYINTFREFFQPKKDIIQYIDYPSHNNLHSYSAFYQSGFENSFALSWDMGGDKSNFTTDGFIEKQHVYSKNYDYNASSIYCLVNFRVMPFNPEIFKTGEEGLLTNFRLDLPGKMMGYSGYLKKHYKDYDKIFYRSEVESIKSAMKNMESQNEFLKRYYGEIPNKIVDFVRDRSQKIAFTDEYNKMFYSSAAQEAFEEFLIEFFYKDNLYMTVQTEYDNNLCMSGGSSLNVLANERLRKEFGFNIFVSPNPGDGNISEGLLYHHMISSIGFFPPRNGSRTNCPLIDLDNIPKPNRVITTEEFCSLLKEGNIIGFLEGDVEYGPRALGRRSILCDPSYPHMKDKINKNVKNREWFRPFAPVCTLESAPIYFDRDRFDDLSFMSFAVNVREEYKEKLSSITHVDGTARLQTVTKTENPVLHNILDTFNGVLLNTSFNVSGKPILNTFAQAMDVLKNTQLDYVVWHDGEKLNLYEDVDIQGRTI